MIVAIWGSLVVEMVLRIFERQSVEVEDILIQFNETGIHVVFTLELFVLDVLECLLLGGQFVYLLSWH